MLVAFLWTRMRFGWSESVGRFCVHAFHWMCVKRSTCPATRVCATHGSYVRLSLSRCSAYLQLLRWCVICQGDGRTISRDLRNCIGISPSSSPSVWRTVLQTRQQLEAKQTVMISAFSAHQQCVFRSWLCLQSQRAATSGVPCKVRVQPERAHAATVDHDGCDREPS